MLFYRASPGIPGAGEYFGDDQSEQTQNDTGRHCRAGRGQHGDRGPGNPQSAGRETAHGDPYQDGHGGTGIGCYFGTATDLVPGTLQLRRHTAEGNQYVFQATGRRVANRVTGR